LTGDKCTIATKYGVAASRADAQGESIKNTGFFAVITGNSRSRMPKQHQNVKLMPKKAAFLSFFMRSPCADASGKSILSGLV
jgi:hypothetical protein